ncbi:MAG TPA: hypothetical protein VGI92_10365 [Gemmatimonadales bacterium]
MSPWTLAKYVLAIAGVALVVSADRLGHRWVGYVGLALIVIAFFLRLAFRVSRHPS